MTVGAPLVDPTGVPSASVTEAGPWAEKVTSSTGFDAAIDGPAATINETNDVSRAADAGLRALQPGAAPL
jgi:hypothetical protein